MAPEELYLLNRLSKINKSPKYIEDIQVDDESLSADRSPNLRGALVRIYKCLGQFKESGFRH